MHVAKCPSPWDQPRLVAPFMMGDIPTPHPHPQTLIWVHEGLCSVEAALGGCPESTAPSRL